MQTGRVDTKVWLTRAFDWTSVMWHRLNNAIPTKQDFIDDTEASLRGLVSGWRTKRSTNPPAEDTALN
jgi:hypothetical protein